MDERLSSTASMMGLSASLRASKDISPLGALREDVLRVKGEIH